MGGCVYCLTTEMLMSFYCFDTQIVWNVQINFISHQVLQVQGRKEATCTEILLK